jgi:hypothetical protein
MVAADSGLPFTCTHMQQVHKTHVLYTLFAEHVRKAKQGADYQHGPMQQVLLGTGRRQCSEPSSA